MMRPQAAMMESGMKLAKVLVVVGFFLMAFVYTAFAAGDGAAFLKIDVDARAIGMGGAYTAFANNSAASYWNPAGLAGADRREASASHADWFSEMSHDHVAYVQPRVFGGSLGLSVTSLRASGIEGRDSQRQSAGSFNAADTAFTVSYGKSYGASRLGLSVKAIEQRLGAHQARGAAVDVGMIRPLPLPGMSLGLTAQNIGPRMSYIGERGYDLPLRLKAGVGYTPSASFSFAADVKYQLREGDVEMACGAEFAPVQAFSLRAGYQFALANGFERFSDGGGSLAGFQGFQGGFGLALGRSYQLDYAVLPFGEMGNTQRVSFSAKF